MGVEVTIGLCVKNSEKTIEKTIASIISQRYPQELLEIIVVDGCSKDKTLSIITNATSKTKIRTKVYSDDGKGLPAARQIALDNAAGRYIMYVDGDVEISGDLVRKQVEYFEKNPGCGMVVGICMCMRGGNNSIVATLENLTNYANCSRLADRSAAFCAENSGPFLKGDKCFRVEALKQAGGFDKNMKGASEDKDITVRVQSKGWTLSLNENAGFHHSFSETHEDLWNEKKWYGYGGHYLRHKYGAIYPIWRNIPLVSFIGGLKLSAKAYRLAQRKIAFLIPLHIVFCRLAWWHGYYGSHIDGYGHRFIPGSLLK